MPLDDFSANLGMYTKMNAEYLQETHKMMNWLGNGQLRVKWIQYRTNNSDQTAKIFKKNLNEYRKIKNK